MSGVVESASAGLPATLASTSAYRKPRKKGFKDKKKHLGTQTIKSCFSPKTNALRRWVEKGVDVVSEIAVHVSRVSNMYVLHCLENSLSLPQLNKQLFDKAAYLLTGTQKENFADAQMLEAYNKLYKPLLNDHVLPRSTDEYRFLDRLTFDMSINACILLRTQFLTRFRQWCNEFVQELIPIEQRAKKTEDKARKLKQRWKVANYLFKETVGGDSRVVDIATLQREAQTALANECVDIWNADVCLRLATAIATTRTELNTEITVEKTFEDENKQKITKIETVYCRPVTFAKLMRTDLNYCYLPWLYKRLQQIELHNSNPNVKQKKLFSLIPIRSLDRCYVTISHTALSEWIYRNRHDETAVGKEIYEKIKALNEDLQKNIKAEEAKKQQETGEQPKKKKKKEGEKKKEINLEAFKAKFERDKLWYWQQCFNLKKVLRNNGKIQFDGPMLTDGVGCSIAVQKPITIKEKKDRENQVIRLQDDNRESDAKIKVLSQEELDESDIVGVDPGRITLYTSAIEKQDGRHKITRYTAKKWRQMSGANDAMRKRNNWAKKESPEYLKWLTDMPTTKVTSVAAMQAHVTHLMKHFDKCFQVNGERKVRKLRMTNYTRRQRALDKMANEFVAQPEAIGSSKKKLIVAFGDAAFKTAGPTKKLKTELRRRPDVTVVDIDEFHTSLMTTCCAFRHTQPEAVERVGPMKKVTDDQGNVSYESLYGVTFCNKCSCIWNRDVNASINMLRIYQHAQANRGARHLFFARSVATSKRQKRTASNREAISDDGVAKKQKLKSYSTGFRTEETGGTLQSETPKCFN